MKTNYDNRQKCISLEHVHTVAVKLLLAASVALWLLSAMGCKSNRPSYNTVAIKSDRFVPELYDAWWSSKAKLERVGAPVRDFKGPVEVSWKIGDTAGNLQGNRVWGLPGRTRGPVLYAQTMSSRYTWMSLTPAGAFQREVAEAEFGHYHLEMDEGFDYPWIRKAGMIP